jgi:hypothetical protein
MCTQARKLNIFGRWGAMHSVNMHTRIHLHPKLETSFFTRVYSSRGGGYRSWLGETSLRGLRMSRWSRGRPGGGTAPPGASGGGGGGGRHTGRLGALDSKYSDSDKRALDPRQSTQSSAPLFWYPKFWHPWSSTEDTTRGPSHIPWHPFQAIPST